MRESYVVDTDVMIDFLRGYHSAIDLFREFAESISFSTITVAEIFCGIKNEQESMEVERLFDIFPVKEPSLEIAKTAGKFVQQYRASHSLQIPDAIIAATCIQNNSQLITLNVKHYPMFKNLKAPYTKK